MLHVRDGRIIWSRPTSTGFELVDLTSKKPESVFYPVEATHERHDGRGRDALRLRNLASKVLFRDSPSVEEAINFFLYGHENDPTTEQPYCQVKG